MITSKDLAYFNAIADWGKACNHTNTNYSIKFRFSKELGRLVTRLFRQQYPNLDLYFYVTKKNMVLLGGEFHKESGVAEAMVRYSQLAKAHMKEPAV